MAVTHICCPHCREEVRIELHVQSKEKGRGPAPIDLGAEVEAFIVDAIENLKMSYRDIAEDLMRREVQTPRGGDTWYPATVQRQYRRVLRKRIADS